LLVKNETEFHRYRKFGVDVSVSFDTPDPIPEEKTKEEPVRQDPSKPDLSKPDPGKKR
jgi:hypothetical protein